MIFRKVTGLFRSKWRTRLYAATSVIAIGGVNGTSALQSITDAAQPDLVAATLA